ncbi:Collagen triple helix repeat-containing protein [Paenibacillus algorifonticola]|uniref:Collagen triple helix repeat-containing protein n=1 Tax=Paenibacillus algorifonticola TaxID=684063 RepID=A0A1I2C1J3_9BACL|nr:Collagen triple helix repeat-containing protein [Paenibacillus algorifonticola]
MSCPDIKKRCKKKTMMVCHPKEKKKKRRLRVSKKIVCEKCPPLEGRQLLEGLAGAIAEAGPQGLAGALGPQGLAGLVGAIGALGPEGIAGALGPQGAAGIVGAIGALGAQGIAGALGPQGLAGLVGAIGALGPEGIAGALGPQGLAGLAGAIGAAGLAGPAGAAGPAGPAGAVGPAGPAGPVGGVLGFADFFALMPPNNAATVATNTDVSFPQDGPISGTAITRINASSFNLSAIGTYQVLFQVNVNEAGQLILTLNGADLAYTVVGRATGTSQIVGMALVQTTLINSVLTVRNPAGNSTALTITPLAGGTRPDSAHLVIMQIA